MTGQELKTARKAKGYTQQSLANLWQCDRVTIARYEARPAIPPIVAFAILGTPRSDGQKLRPAQFRRNDC